MQITQYERTQRLHQCVLPAQLFQTTNGYCCTIITRIAERFRGRFGALQLHLIRTMINSVLHII